MSNLLNSIEIATLFLDDDLAVRRYTPQTTSIIKLIPGDAGRPITDLVSLLDYPELARDAREVLRALRPHEQQVPTSDGRWFTVRIMPYRTQDNRISGVVITFLDISIAKLHEASLEDALVVLQDRFPDPQARTEKIKKIEQVLQVSKLTLQPLRSLASAVPAKPAQKPQGKVKRQP
jgi:two-component system CheB/CheR fusion protein